MKPIPFKQHNTCYAKDQPEYLPLPAFKQADGLVVHCWYANIIERLRILLTGRVWVHSHTFNQPLQPILVTSQAPEFTANE